MVIMGVIATAAVSLAIKPVSARKELREDLRKATDSLSDMMSMITTSFLSGEDELNDPSFVAASTRYKNSFNSLTKDLKEAKNEHYLLGTEKEYEIEARLVKCMERLAQNIGGLRSAASTQFTLLRSSYGPGNNSLASSFPRLDSPQFPDFSSVRDRIHSLSAIYEAPEESSDAGGDQTPKRASSTDASSIATVLSPADMFSTFISHLGPPMVCSLRKIAPNLTDRGRNLWPTLSNRCSRSFHLDLALSTPSQLVANSEKVWRMLLTCSAELEKKLWLWFTGQRLSINPDHLT